MNNTSNWINQKPLSTEVRIRLQALASAKALELCDGREMSAKDKEAIASLTGREKSRFDWYVTFHCLQEQ